jgi:hypothetical protein
MGGNPHSLDKSQLLPNLWQGGNFKLLLSETHRKPRDHPREDLSINNIREDLQIPTHKEDL